MVSTTSLLRLMAFLPAVVSAGQGHNSQGQNHNQNQNGGGNKGNHGIGNGGSDGHRGGHDGVGYGGHNGGWNNGGHNGGHGGSSNNGGSNNGGSNNGVPEDGSKFDYDAVSYREVGSRNTVDWRVWLEYNNQTISFWHDIPLYPDSNNKTIVNCYTEISRWTDGKIETSRDEALNPIFHDTTKKNKVKFVYSVWPHKSYPFNYGSIPQTWEDATKVQNYTQLVGDNDPIDIFDISSVEPATIGEIRQVKILGGLPMVDDDRSDWKVIAIYVDDPLAPLVNSVEDLDTYRPNLRQEFLDWFTYYKVVKGDGTNTIIGGDYRKAAEVQDLIAESHEYWKDLVQGKNNSYITNEISINQTSHSEYKISYVNSEVATHKFNIPTTSNISEAAERPEEYDEWYYLDADFNLIELN